MNELDLDFQHVVFVSGDEICLVFLDCGGLQLFNFVDDAVDAKVSVWNALCGVFIRSRDARQMVQ